MYSHLGSGYALFNVKRFAFGAYQITIRYPEDPYDRKWYSAYGLFTTNVRGEAEIPKIDVSGAEDYPPAAVLQNASTVNSTTSYIQLDTYLRDSPVPIYITTFFSEVVHLFTTSPNYKRSFQIYVDDEPYSEEIVPPFGGVVEVAITNITASSNTTITLRSTSDANLPVLINAFEVYTVSELLSPGTDTRDLEGLALLQLQFEESEQLQFGWCITGMSCPPPPPQVTPPAETPPAETPPASPPDYQVPSAPNTTPLSSGSHPPPPDEFHIPHLLPPTIRLRSCFYY
ncbi:hypothetical protein ACLB2K_075459 [Fragaria x ananassa]